MNKINKILTQLARLAFLGLLVFELLNFFQVFHFKIHFSWLTLASLTLIGWLTWEIISHYLKKQGGYSLINPIAFLCLSAIYVDALGNVYQWYTDIGWYDRLAHLIGGGAAGGIAFAILWALNSSGKIRLSTKAIGIFALSMAAALGALYEIEEYFEDRFLGSHRLGDGPDVADDLFLDIVGALVVILIIILCLRLFRKKKSKANENC